MKYFVLLLAFSFFISCQREDSKSIDFDLPNLVSFVKDEPLFFYEESISGQQFKIVAKTKYSSNIELEKDFKEYDGLIFEPNEEVENNLFDFEVLVDYQKTVPYFSWEKDENAYYPIYFVNKSANVLYFHGKDDYVFAVQEAFNKELNEWGAIEHFAIDFCGNGKFALKVDKGECVIVLARKFKGDYETMLRFRIPIGDSVFVSEPFAGVIRNDQFRLSKESKLLSELDNNELCYGAKVLFKE